MKKAIADNIYWIDGGASNMFFCVDGDGVTLIDCGMPRRAQLVWDAMAELGHAPAALTRILVTHADMDHVGSLAALQTASGAKVYAGVASAALLPQGKSPQHMPPLVQFFMDRFVRYGKVPADVVQTIADGDVLPVLDGLEALATPGHTMDHFSFYHPLSGTLFTGDALNTRNGRLQSTPPRITADQDAARQSAIRLLQLTPAVFACGHGTPFADHTSKDIMMLFNQLRQE